MTHIWKGEIIIAGSICKADEQISMMENNDHERIQLF